MNQSNKTNTDNMALEEMVKSLDARQCRLVLSMVNDVLYGRRIAVTFTHDRNGSLVEAGTRKVIEPGDKSRK